MSIARQAWPFVTPPAALALVALAVGWRATALVLALTGLLIAAFFRVPRRRFAGDRRAVLAPANGVVTAIDRLEEPAIGAGVFHRVVTFLSVFDVHVQRAPVAGEVVDNRLHPGRKLAAFRPQAGEENECHLLVLRTEGGDRLAIKQIAGLLARRVVCHARTGDRLERGERFGIIKFGSRVDLYLPESWPLAIEKGERLTEGSTVVATAP